MNKLKSKVTVVRYHAVLLFFAALAAIIATPATAAPRERAITDKGITAAVESGLFYEKGVFPNDIDVTTDQGIVMLGGWVDNILADERAVKVAESIRGVRGVIDRIAVKPVHRADEDIRKDILTALLQDPATESYKIAVSVKDAAVTLTGSVGSFAEKQLTGFIAEGVKGTRAVRNDVEIVYPAKRTDQEIAADVKERLQWDVWTADDMIYTAVKDGKVVLTGIVGSAIVRSRAYDDAWQNGVVSVNDSGIIIEPWARNGSHKQSKIATPSEENIKKAVQSSLRFDPRVSEFSPDITVEGGTVVLSGIVGNLKARIAAEQDVKNIVGVWWVKNLLKVRPANQPADTEIKMQLTAALRWDPLLEGSAIDVKVIGRVAELSGAVGLSFQKAEAQDIASRTKGVVSVRNRLMVEPDVSNSYFSQPGYSTNDWIAPMRYPSDGQIKKSVEDELFWNPFVTSKNIKVAVQGGIITLTGTVGMWIGWDEVNKDAYRSGAMEVKNMVKVKNGWRR